MKSFIKSNTDLWWTTLNDEVDLGNVKTTRCHVCCYQTLVATVTETLTANNITTVKAAFHVLKEPQFWVLAAISFDEKNRLWF